MENIPKGQTINILGEQYQLIITSEKEDPRLANVLPIRKTVA